MLRNKKLKIAFTVAAEIFAIWYERNIFKFKRIYCAVGLQFDYLEPGAR